MPEIFTDEGSPEIGIIIVAAGRGERLGAQQPKAFVQLAGHTLLSYSIRTITSLPHRGQLVIVAPLTHLENAIHDAASAAAPGSTWLVNVIAGGSERDESVRNGIAALHPTVRTVLVHDAARPLASPELFTRVIRRVQETGDGVIPALPVTDTIKRVSADGIVNETVDRAPLAAVQTPQGFPAAVLAAAHQALSTPLTAAGLPTDDAEVVQRNGGTVRVEAGEALAMKVTTASDLDFLTVKLRTMTDWFDSDTHPESAGQS